MQKNVMELFRLNGRRALITGGAKGLGRVIAQAFAEAGADVAVASRTLADCQKAADEIARSTGRQTAAFAVNVAVRDDVRKLREDVEASLGTIDILVNNAGINIRGPIEELSETDFNDVLSTNLTAPFLCSQISARRCASEAGVA